MAGYSSLEIIAIIFISIFVCKLLLSLLRGLWTCFLGHSFGFGVKWRSGEDVWAVITGGTDGIGLEYAKQLAQKGYSIVIISRSEERLNAVAKSLREDYECCKVVKTLAVDFSETDIYEEIEKCLDELLDIDVLVNNVGTAYHIPEYFLTVPKHMNYSLININMISANKMLEIVLPKMVVKRRGIIINVSSATSDQPFPLSAMYSASKAFLTFLSEALSVEYESKGVIIQTVLPNLVKTKLSTNLFIPLMFVSPHDYVSSALKTVGIENSTYGHWKHKLFAHIFKISVNIFGKRFVMKQIYRWFKILRNNFYKNNYKFE